MQKVQTIPTTVPVAGTLTRRWPAYFTISLGLAMVYFLGFAPFTRAHNASHDTRHANGFPCH